MEYERGVWRDFRALYRKYKSNFDKGLEKRCFDFAYIKRNNKYFKVEFRTENAKIKDILLLL